MGKHEHRDETDEEKRARRLAKKERKRAREEQQLIPGYSNDANRWNDPNLASTFVWKRKEEKVGRGGADAHGGGSSSDSRASAEQLKRRREEQLRELEKVKRAREEREAEKLAWEQEKEMLEREREQMAYVDNEKREEEFMLKQTRMRAHIRVGEGRAKPIDLLSESLTLLLPDLDVQAALDIRPEDPQGIFHGCNTRELRDLHTEICKREQLDEPNAVFWGAMRTLSEARTGAGGENQGGNALNDAVKQEVASMLHGKNAEELDELAAQIDAQLAEADADATDGDYWRVVSDQLSQARAAQIVSEAFAQMKSIKARVMAEHAPSTADADAEVGTATGGMESASGGIAGAEDGRFSPELFDDEEEASGLAEQGEASVGASTADDPADAHASGRFSPPLLAAHQVVGEAACDADVDFQELWAERKRIRASLGMGREPAAGRAAAGGAQSTQPRSVVGSSSAADPSGAGSSGGAADDETARDASLVEAEARRGMESGEARFSFEVPLEKKVSWWHDKYRPRKPKYFNRVHTGYEWNKYNQTHYDHDNPPPKMVQGYKFAIFYPDLIDRTKTPTYSLHPDPDGSKDTCILKFKGGPPYEDLAFKIVNQEWEHSHKRGFRCRFERGILQLHFGFKRFRYRR